MSVKETAEAILAADTIAANVGPGDETIDYLPASDVKAMAKLWLLKPSTLEAMQNFRDIVDGKGGAAFADFARDRFDRAIEALEDNDE